MRTIATSLWNYYFPPKLPEPWTAEAVARSFGIPLVEAEHSLAIGRGEISGDFVIPARNLPDKKE